jgi:hypothetical protein
MAQLLQLDGNAHAVLEAISEHDRLGRDVFLQTYHFGKPKEYFVQYKGEFYPSKAIMGVAFAMMPSTQRALKPSEFSGGKRAAVRYFERMGFKVFTLVNENYIPLSDLDDATDSIAEDLERDNVFDPQSTEDARRRVLQEIAQRRGQRQFREKLLKAYVGRCAISRFDCVPALEAAHILPYRSDGTNHVTNGILLRSDLHTLFDLRKIAIAVHDGKWTALLTNDLRQTSYRRFNGAELWLPANASLRPNLEAINQHRAETGL